MLTWGCATSSLADLHLTQVALFWLSGHQPCACYWPRPPLTLLQMSLLSPSHIYMHRGVRTQTHRRTHTSACLQAPHSSVSASFCLPSACRLEDRGSEGGPRERRVARQNGWSHEHRSVYKPKAEQSRSKRRKGKANRRLLLSLSTIKDWKRKRGSLPWQSQLEVGETKHDTRRHTRAHTQPLSLSFFFFFSQLKEQMVRGRVGSPPPTHTCTDWHTNTHSTSEIPNPATGLLLTAWSCPHFVWDLEGSTSLPSALRRNTHCRIRGLEEETTGERRGGWDLWKSSVKKAALRGRQSTD